MKASGTEAVVEAHVSLLLEQRDGTYTFVVEDGKIVSRTFAMRAQPAAVPEGLP